MINPPNSRSDTTMDSTIKLRRQLIGITPTIYAGYLTPSPLIALTSLNSLEYLKKLKNEYICGNPTCRSRSAKSSSTSTSYCKSCSTIRKHMCNQYHNSQKSPLHELVLRLVYEYLFDIISLEDIKTHRWLDNRLRDPGHTLRLRICYSKVKKKSLLSECRWLIQI